MNKRRRFKAKRRRAGRKALEALRYATFPFWRANPTAVVSHDDMLNAMRNLFKNCE